MQTGGPFSSGLVESLRETASLDTESTWVSDILIAAGYLELLKLLSVLDPTTLALKPQPKDHTKILRTNNETETACSPEVRIQHGMKPNSTCVDTGFSLGK